MIVTSLLGPAAAAAGGVAGGVASWAGTGTFMHAAAKKNKPMRVIRESNIQDSLLQAVLADGFEDQRPACQLRLS